MRSVLLIADTAEKLAQLQRMLDDTYTLFTAGSQNDALEYLRLTKVDIVIAALEARASHLEQFFAQAKGLQPYCVTLYLAPPAAQQTSILAGRGSDFFLSLPVRSEELRLVMTQALDKQRLVEEAGWLRRQGTTPPSSWQPANVESLSLTRLGQILHHFAKALRTNGDLRQGLDLFLDAISEFLRPSRSSIFVLNPVTQRFEILAYHGLPPKVAESLRLQADEGLALWLSVEARMLHRAEVESRLHLPSYLELHRDMQALRSVASIPLIAAGSLVGILNLGERVTGLPYTEDELDMLFSLSSHVALSIQDNTLYQTLESQKMFIENILTHMNSSVITIGTDEKIRIFNHRAAAVLGQLAADILNTDLRNLPSPLGDMLYETLHDGTTYEKHEIMLAAKKIPLEINTYQIFDRQQNILGSVMVFEDISAQKQLYEARKRADQLDFLNKVVGRMAHEVKNPLVSIKTFVELLHENYDDVEFRHHFKQVVSQDVNTIDTITEKLVSFSSEISYQFEYLDVNECIMECICSIEYDKNESSRYKDNNTELDKDIRMDISHFDTNFVENLPLVKIDKQYFSKSLLYILLYIRKNCDTQNRIHISSKDYSYENGRKTVNITISGNSNISSNEDIQNLFDPFSMERSELIDIGPCVSQKIIEEHGGRLDVRLGRNGEVTFVISLPVIE